MHLLLSFVLRDEPPASSPPGIYQPRCKTVVSRLKLCPVDVALWVVLFAVVIFICWFVYSTQRGGRSKTSHRKVYRRLSLPYPTAGSAEFAQYSGFEYDKKMDSASSSATLIDPYHVVNKLDNSLIAKDASFNAASLPTPTLDQKRAAKLTSGLGLGIVMDDSPLIPLKASSNEPPVMNEKISTPPPEYAHVRSAWWES
ncbi:hypothetical protein CVT26_014837 [Gymnopilus dilepis]|uniref:Uncharacterized protein n=1 Tax=Gymnopilus dilepis TaxID=231916 RepID=A0A409XX08_9AGAR|nr:hypothetical protein CVT26_014837 [Gymnopilus dilepis]